MQNQQRNYAVKMFKNLANARRIKILEVIMNENGICVDAISKITGIAQSSTSNYLAQMRKDGLISAKQNGLNMHYSIKDSNVKTLLKTVGSKE
jgi:DNA-binding transcriptional ArsR family regulator